jgi:acyl-CoA thioester hydrolase
MKDSIYVTHSVQFHEVDSMGIVHHSQYLLWLEKARFTFAKETIGFSMKDFENNGFLLPVTKLECKYIKSIKLDQQVRIYIKLIETEIALVKFCYEVYDEITKMKLMEAVTEQVFVNGEGQLLLKNPEIWKFKIEEMKQKQPHFLTQYTHK